MNQRMEETKDMNEDRVRRAIQSAPAPKTDADFRARLREDFVSGAIEVRGTREKRERARRRVVIFPRTGHPGRTGMWAAAAVAMAAALVLIVGNMNQGHPWWVTGARGEGVAMIDGKPVPLSDHDALDRAIKPGSKLVLPAGAEVDLCSNGVLAMQLTERADITIPQPPRRWFNRRSEMQIRMGEVRFATGVYFPGAHMRIHTQDAAVEIVGTTFAVIAQHNGTCVCVLEGVAKVGRVVNAAGTDMQPVPGGHLRFIYRDANRPPGTDEMRPWERGLLSQFNESMRPWLAGEYKDGGDDDDDKS